jgi:hypothetical protein
LDPRSDGPWTAAEKRCDLCLGALVVVAKDDGGAMVERQRGERIEQWSISSRDIRRVLVAVAASELSSAADVTTAVQDDPFQIWTWRLEPVPALIHRDERIMDCVLGCFSRSEHQHSPPRLAFDLTLVEVGEPGRGDSISVRRPSFVSFPIVARSHPHTASTFQSDDLIHRGQPMLGLTVVNCRQQAVSPL